MWPRLPWIRKTFCQYVVSCSTISLIFFCPFLSRDLLASLLVSPLVPSLVVFFCPALSRHLLCSRLLSPLVPSPLVFTSLVPSCTITSCLLSSCLASSCVLLCSLWSRDLLSRKKTKIFASRTPFLALLGGEDKDVEGRDPQVP